MNDRELLEYIAAQVGNLTKDVADVKNDMQDLKEDVGEIKNQLTTIEVEHGRKLDALFDGHGQNTEAIKEMSNKMDELSKKIETHDVEISVIKRVK